MASVRRNTKKTTPNPARRRRRSRYGLRYEITGILLLFFSLVGLWAIFAPEEGEGGVVSSWLRAACGFLAGRLGWLVLFYLGGLGVYLILKRIRPSPFGPWLGLSIFLLVILSAFDLFVHPSSSLTLAELGQNENGGGFLG
ncbi:MAG: hypothetical protein GX493_13145 [Firmicutes bacterium]|nr:hypothetical protein [Bacillota bacterium]